MWPVPVVRLERILGPFVKAALIVATTSSRFEIWRHGNVDFRKLSDQFFLKKLGDLESWNALGFSR